ncbi:MAG: Mov34/MPN/PAD-1 family protein [Mycobacterium leprae]
MQTSRLVIPQPLLQKMLEHCLDERPCEACGILAGRDGHVTSAYATDNTRHSPVYYEVEPTQQEQALKQMAEQHEELVAIYHSHPTAPAKPSQNDIRMAVHYPEAVRVIISLDGPAEVRAFRINGWKVEEIGLAAPVTAEGHWHDLRRQETE